VFAVTAPVVLLEIEGKRLSRDLTDRLVSFVYEDHEMALDLLEITLADPYLQLIDDPLFQEGHEIRARFGYTEQLSPIKVGVIKEIAYDFPETGVPTITLKAYDKGCRLSAEQVQRVWTRAGGIRTSDIATTLAQEHGLTPVVTPTVDRFPRLHQSKQSDAQWLASLAKTARAAVSGLSVLNSTARRTSSSASSAHPSISAQASGPMAHSDSTAAARTGPRPSSAHCRSSARSSGGSSSAPSSSCATSRSSRKAWLAVAICSASVSAGSPRSIPAKKRSGSEVRSISVLYQRGFALNKD